MTTADPAKRSEAVEPEKSDTVVIIGPQPMAVHDPEDDDAASPADMVGQPAKVMRIGSMIKQLLEEVRAAPLDKAGRGRLARIYDTSLDELKDGLSPELVAELHRIALPFSQTDSVPSESELRIAQAQLVGWLEGLFHGIQTALMAQQMAAQAQHLASQQHQRRALPGPVRSPAEDPETQPRPGQGTGQYL